MIKFLTNPLEYIFNCFGYTILPNKSFLLMTVMDFTHENHLEQLTRQGRLHEITVK